MQVEKRPHKRVLQTKLNNLLQSAPANKATAVVAEVYEQLMLVTCHSHTALYHPAWLWRTDSAEN